MIKIRCVLKNKNRRGLLLEPMTQEIAMDIWRRKQKSKVIDKEIHDIAEGMLPRDNEGWIALPIRYPYGSFKAGGRHVSYKGKANITSSKGETMLYSFLEIEEEESGHVRLFNGDRSSQPEWQPLVRVTRNDKGEAVVKICPMIKDWRAELHLLVDDTESVNERMVRDLVEQSGKKAGFGAGRPQKGGGNGQYIIEDWEVFENGNEKSAKSKAKSPEKAAAPVAA